MLLGRPGFWVVEREAACAALHALRHGIQKSLDDFTAWVTGPTAQSIREEIEEIIKDALEWGKRSGATFEAENLR